MSHVSSPLDQYKNNNKRISHSNILRRHWTLVEKWSFPFALECVSIWTCKRVNYWTSNHLYRFHLHPHFLFEEKESNYKMIITLFSLKTERQWWNSNSIFAFSLPSLLRHTQKKEKILISLSLSLPLWWWKQIEKE